MTVFFEWVGATLVAAFLCLIAFIHIYEAGRNNVAKQLCRDRGFASGRYSLGSVVCITPERETIWHQDPRP